MGIKHKTVKASGEAGYSTEWNDEHKIDSDIDFAGHSGVNLGEPIASSDIATKNYVDSQVPGAPPGTFYWSCPGANFKLVRPDVFSYTEAIYSEASGIAQATSNNYHPFIVSVNLPNGAVVTEAIVYGNNSTKTWILHRTLLTAPAGGAMASANMNTVDTTISNATIDNSLYGYFFVTSSLERDGQIYGARITYTL